MNEVIKTRITRARVQLLMKFPFFGTLALSLRLEEDEKVGTAGTDGEIFVYNPKFIEGLTDAELHWLIAHEVMHCALGHIWRRNNRNKEKFNIAADYAIHCILYESKSDSFKMPEGCLYDPKFNDKSSEEIYDLLPDIPQMKNKSQQVNGNENSDGDGDGSGKNGNSKTLDNHDYWEKKASSKEQKEKMKREWTEKMISAAEVSEAKKQGSVPGSIKRLIGKLTKPQKDWRELLADFIQFEVFDYGFCPPDKRFSGLDYLGDVLMPDYSEMTEKLQDLVFVIDTSGSIGDKELCTFYSELVGMMQQFSSSVKGRLLFVDTDVAAEYEFGEIDDILKSKPAGGGGTDMEEAIRYSKNKMDSNDWDVAGCIILTDGYTSFNLKESDIPFDILWVITNEDVNPPYGKIARLKLK